MAQVLVDMDGILADVYSQFQQFEKCETSHKIPSDEIMGKPELNASPNGGKHVQ